MSGANVVDQDSHAAIFHIVADAWNGNIEQVLFSIGSPQLSRFRKNRRSEQKQQANDDSAYSHLFSSEETIMPFELSVVDGVLCPAKTPPQLNLLLVRCYTTCLVCCSFQTSS